jgi:hypothetical protein
VAADDQEPVQEAADDDANAPGQDEWNAYPLIVFVILLTVLLTVFGLGPSLGAFLPGLVHH